MSSWFEKYMHFNLTGRLVMIACVAMSWRSAEWFMSLENPTTQQSAYISVIMGIMSGIYGIYISKESKGSQK